MQRTDADVDSDYLKSLGQKLSNEQRLCGCFAEDRLQKIKKGQNKKASAFARSTKEHHFDQLLSANAPISQIAADGQEVDNTPLESNWLQRKVAPQTCALSREDRAPLVKHDNLEVFLLINLLCFMIADL